MWPSLLYVPARPSSFLEPGLYRSLPCSCGVQDENKEFGRTLVGLFLYTPVLNDWDRSAEQNLLRFCRLTRCWLCSCRILFGREYLDLACRFQMTHAMLSV